MRFEMMEGTPGTTLDDVGHVLLPGRYRSPDGMGLHPFSAARADTGAAFAHYYNLLEHDGIVVCSGYKNPGDNAGEPWRDEAGIEYQGVPEALGMRRRLIDARVPSASIRTEVESVDTVTNLTNSQRLFPDNKPVGIVAQEQHLARILRIIAPRTMERPYVGIVVPEIPGNTDGDGFAAALVSRYITRGLRPDRADNAWVAQERAERVWRVVLGVKSLGLPSRSFDRGVRRSSQSS